ncbi:hypothetical protein AF78_04915 [Aliarcobacter butzleri L353]|uniref:hypothetical protein n=1 Tax=Aliarcobacter butzleri TaxID=28197 RepID=UPI000659D22E|nr:hypothetical protein [Aliarcobacter butzleri]KLE05839.1 hypothetical protein AF78_04915 [Aliarcobacter butzleri L353]
MGYKFKLEDTNIVSFVTTPNVHRGYKVPYITVLGKFNGETKASVRDFVAEKIKKSFKNLNLKSKAFIMVSSSGDTWSHIFIVDKEISIEKYKFTHNR